MTRRIPRHIGRRRPIDRGFQLVAVRLGRQRHRRLHNPAHRERRLPGDLRAIGKADLRRLGLEVDVGDAQLGQGP